jgi:hypothetical protein
MRADDFFEEDLDDNWNTVARFATEKLERLR